LRAYLQEQGIGTLIHYPLPVHLQPAYRDLAYARGSLPITEQLAREVLSLPLYPELPLAAVTAVAGAIQDFDTATDSSVPPQPAHTRG